MIKKVKWTVTVEGYAVVGGATDDEILANTMGVLGAGISISANLHAEPISIKSNVKIDSDLTSPIKSTNQIVPIGG